MRTVGIIPARWASTRFPGKSLALLHGKPLTQWVWERCCLAENLDDVIIATDDKRIVAAAEGWGARAVMTSATHPSGTDRVAEAAKNLDADLIINIQGDEPLIDPNLIDQLILMAKSTNWDMVTAASPLLFPQDLEYIQSPSVCKVVFDANRQALYFSRSPIPFVRDADFIPPGTLYWRHIGIYLYKKQFLKRLVQEPPSLLEKAECLEQLRALHIGGSLGVVCVSQLGLGVDTPSDIKLAEAALKAAGLVS